MLNGTYAEFAWLKTRTGLMCTKNVQAGLFQRAIGGGG